LRFAAGMAGAPANRDSGIIASGMDLTFFAILIMGGWVVAMVAAGLVMVLRPGGVAVRLAAAGDAAGAPAGPRDEILLGGDAEVLGNVRGRVESVQLRPESCELQSIGLATGLETQTVPATAILSADGRVVRLAESWIESPDGSDGKAATLRQDMAVKGSDGKRLGRLRLVCFDPASRKVTALVIAGRGALSQRLLPVDHVREVGPDGVFTDLRSADWAKLQPFATDWEIRQAVLDQLAADPKLQAAQRSISVDVVDQVVRLRGYAADSSQTEQLARLIRSVPGVLQIDRKLITDEDLSRAVTEAIRRNPATSAAQVQVNAHDGTVDITGEAPDRSAARAVDRVASQVPGVQAVHNMVAVRRPTAASA
jgi:osmotically-inducible protein OsmY